MPTLKTRALDLAKSPPLQLALGAAVVILAVFYIVKKTLGAAADAAGGLLTGDNPLTANTPYAGAGVPGTLGAAVDRVTGGAGQAIGGSAIVQDALTALFNDGYDGYLYRGRTVLQVVRRSDGKVFNVDAAGHITGPA